MTPVAEEIGALNFLDQIRPGIVEFSQGGILWMLQPAEQIKKMESKVLFG
jgi:hypothetical protein